MQLTLNVLRIIPHKHLFGGILRRETAHARTCIWRNATKVGHWVGTKRVTTYKKGVFMRLVFDTSELRKLLSLVMDEATVDVLGMCLYASLCRFTHTLRVVRHGDNYIHIGVGYRRCSFN